MAPNQISRSGRSAVFAVVMLAVLVVTILWFATSAPQTVPSHVGFDGSVDGASSKSEILFIVVPISLIISGGFAFRPLSDKVPLRICRMPFVFHGAFWIAEGRSDFLRTRMQDYLQILSGISSGFFASTLWMSWFRATSHTVPEAVPPLLFWALAVLFLAATIRHYLRLRPSQWTPEESPAADDSPESD